MAGARDYFPKSGTGQTSSSYGRVQDSLIVYDEELALKHSRPIDESASYTGATTWNAGQWARWNSGNVEKVSSAAQTPVGMFYLDRNSTTDETSGANEVTLIEGANGVEFLTDQVDASDTFSPGDALYVNADGNLSTTDGGGPVVARCTASKASDGFIKAVLMIQEA